MTHGKIGVFDSGIGGLAIARTLEKALPGYDIICVSDSEHLPYGDKNPEQVLKLTLPLIEKLVTNQCDLVVIACNTVTTHHIAELRRRFDVPFVGIEPMIKPAALATKTGVMAVCATPATLASDRYIWLKQTYALDIKVLEPDCCDWAYMIEKNEINEQKIRTQIESVLTQHADVVVLGCTHYHWIEMIIKKMVDERAIVIQPEQAIVSRVKDILEQINSSH